MCFKKLQQCTVLSDPIVRQWKRNAWRKNKKNVCIPWKKNAIKYNGGWIVIKTLLNVRLKHDNWWPHVKIKLVKSVKPSTNAGDQNLTVLFRILLQWQTQLFVLKGSTPKWFFKKTTTKKLSLSAKAQSSYSEVQFYQDTERALASSKHRLVFMVHNKASNFKGGEEGQWGASDSVIQ